MLLYHAIDFNQLKYSYNLRLEKHIISAFLAVYKYYCPSSFKVRDFNGSPGNHPEHAERIHADFKLPTSTPNEGNKII